MSMTMSPAFTIELSLQWMISPPHMSRTPDLIMTRTVLRPHLQPHRAQTLQACPIILR
ncbi:hypothetical protein M9458_024029, partial [Cirrhinus mrigala]